MAKVPRPEKLNVKKRREGYDLIKENVTLNVGQSTKTWEAKCWNCSEDSWELGRRNGQYMANKQVTYKTITNWYFGKRREENDLVKDIYEMYSFYGKCHSECFGMSDYTFPYQLPWMRGVFSPLMVELRFNPSPQAGMSFVSVWCLESWELWKRSNYRHQSFM